MVSEDFIDLHMVGDSDNKNESGRLNNSNSEPSEVDLQHSTSLDISNMQKLVQSEGFQGSENDPNLQTMDLDKDLVHKQPGFQEIAGLVESVAISEMINGVRQPGFQEIAGLVESVAISEMINGVSHSVQDTEEISSLSTQTDNTVRSNTIDQSYISGTKRARKDNIEQPSIRITYSSLTRASKKKLEELIQQWSQWHAHHDFSYDGSSKEVLESGEETFFPALRVGLENSNTVSFWLDNQALPEPSKGFTPLDCDSAPLYDRGYAFGLTSLGTSPDLGSRGIEMVEASRCFNCDSYNHSVKECPKPRDNVAVSNARKKNNLKRNLTAGPRCPSRYYQSTPGGKFEGIRPGVLSSETRDCLGIGELDPPPWLNRMREIGYPPGYLDFNLEDQPSGITIHADSEPTDDREDGELPETAEPELPEKKMTVEFPGVNSPIPENADEILWGPSTLNSERKRLHPRSRRSVDAGDGASDYGYRQRYGSYNSMGHQDSRDYNPLPRGTALGRTLSDRSWRSPSAREDSTDQHSFHIPSRHSSSNSTRHSPPDFDRWIPEREHSSQRKDRYDHRHHNSN